MALESQRRIQLFAPTRRRDDEASRPDYFLMVIVGALVTIGVLTIYSVSFGPNLANGTDPFTLVEKQALWLFVGGIAMLVAMRLDYHWLQRLAVPLMGLTVLSLVLVLFFGTEVLGARRWFLEGSFQPGELAKIATVIYIATWVTSKGTKLRQILYGLVPFSILVGVVAGLIALEPNYSTALLIALTAFAMFFIAGADVLQFGLSTLIGSLTAAGLISQSAHAMERISLLWTDVFKVPSDQVWQLEQTLIALASGGIFGKGLGTGGGQYGYVPLAHSDAIFAIWGEETGLVGTWILVGLVLALAYRGFRIASKAPDDFGRVLAAGITIWLTFQAFINIGVVTQLVPFTGQPLPFISYGGSSLVTALAGIGLLLSISRGKPVPVVVKSAPRAQSTPRGVESAPRKAPRRAGAFDFRVSKQSHASIDNRRRDRGPRVPAVSRSTKPRRRPRRRDQE
jgi:cell division protein FtsW